MKTGVIKFWNESKKFGFIIPDEGGDDVFVHVTNVVGKVDLVKDQHVEYEIYSGKSGKIAAKNVNGI